MSDRIMLHVLNEVPEDGGWMHRWDLWAPLQQEQLAGRTEAGPWQQEAPERMPAAAHMSGSCCASPAGWARHIAGDIGEADTEEQEGTVETRGGVPRSVDSRLGGRHCCYHPGARERP